MMANVKDQIAQAKASGYSDADIAQHLSAKPEYAAKFKAATDAGYKPAEIISHLTSAGSSDTPVADTKAPKKSGVDQIPTGGNITIPSTSASTPDGSKDNLLGRAFGKYEVPVAMATGMAGGLIGNIAGFAKSVVGGKYGTPEGVQQGQQTATDVAHALTYKPRSETDRKSVV